MTEIVVFGGGGHAKVVIDTIEQIGKYKIIGIIDLPKDTKNEVLGYPILGSEEILPKLNCTHGVLAIGDSRLRMKLASFISQMVPAFKFITLVNPSTSIGSDVELGEGSVILAGAIINIGSRVGKHCIVNTRSSLDHENQVADFVSVAPGVTTGGNVTIGFGTSIGIGATIKNNILIGDNTEIGAGSLVLKDQPSNSVCYGHPCKVIRKRDLN